MKDENLILEKFKEAGDYENELAQYQKQGKKKDKKIRKLKKQRRVLRRENDELRKKLDHQKKKYHKLKKTIQLERYQSGINPFLPLNTYDISRQHKSSKTTKRKDIYCLSPCLPVPPDPLKKANVVQDAEFREI